MISKKIQRFFNLSGAGIEKVYKKNKMGVHNQGHYLSVASPQAVTKAGTLSLSAILSPYGTVTGLNNAGALIFLNDHPLQLASVPYVQIDGSIPHMLTIFDPSTINHPDDFPLPQNYYYPSVAGKNASISIATPLAQFHYHIEKTDVVRRIVSPLFSECDRFNPVWVEEYEISNGGQVSQQITLVVPLPSLVNISLKESRPREQDYSFLGYAATNGHLHKRFSTIDMAGVQMESTMSSDRMIIAVEKHNNITIDVQEAFRLRNYNQDLVLNPDGTFHHPNAISPGNDYGAAVSITVNVNAGSSVKFPVVKVLDFPQQHYSDNVSIPRHYPIDFPDATTRAMKMAAQSLKNYPLWLDNTLAIQEKLLKSLRKSPSYLDDNKGALRVARLLFNELSYLFSNASVLDSNGHARFLECFDYPFNNSADVDFYSKLLLSIFPQMEIDLCQIFIDSINQSNPKQRFYHNYVGDPVLQRAYLEEIRNNNRVIGTDIHIYAAEKEEGSVYHDLGSLTRGNPLRNGSEYTWYNTSYWIDLFPKLSLRVLRDTKYTGNTRLITDNWKTLIKGFTYLLTLDYDGDGIPEGRPGEVRNTYDNIPFAGLDAYDANLFVSSVKAMIRMAEIVGDSSEMLRFESILQKAMQTYEKLWLKTIDAKGNEMAYYITCAGVDGKGRCTDVFTDQIVGLWQWIAMGEKPFLPSERVVPLLKTIYVNNRTPMGWATARKQDGTPVESDQGKDVWIASNYVLAQMLDYYDMTKESKEVYSVMDHAIFEHGNSLNSPESVRPEYEQQEGERKACPHYIVASYPRPGAIYDILYLNAIKEEWKKNPDAEYIDSKKLQEIRAFIFSA